MKNYVLAELCDTHADLRGELVMNPRGDSIEVLKREYFSKRGKTRPKVRFLCRIKKEMYKAVVGNVRELAGIDWNRNQACGVWELVNCRFQGLSQQSCRSR